MSELRVKSVLFIKPGLGHWQRVQTQNVASDQVCTVCENYRKLRVKWNSFKSPFRTISWPTHKSSQPTSAVSALSFISLWKHMLWVHIATDKALFFIRKMLISFFFLFHENIGFGQGASNEYPQHIFLWRNKKNIMWIPPLICSYGVHIRSASLRYF